MADISSSQMDSDGYFALPRYSDVTLTAPLSRIGSEGIEYLTDFTLTGSTIETQDIVTGRVTFQMPKTGNVYVRANYSIKTDLTLTLIGAGLNSYSIDDEITANPTVGTHTLPYYSDLEVEISGTRLSGTQLLDKVFINGVEQTDVEIGKHIL